jgi:predicted ester cyclase
VHISVEDVVAENDTVVACVILEGTHTGASMGIPPSGNRLRVAGVAIVRFANGQAVEAWNVWDQLGLLRQVGAIPGSEGQDRFVASPSRL